MSGGSVGRGGFTEEEIKKQKIQQDALWREPDRSAANFGLQNNPFNLVTAPMDIRGPQPGNLAPSTQPSNVGPSPTAGDRTKTVDQQITPQPPSVSTPPTESTNQQNTKGI